MSTATVVTDNTWNNLREQYSNKISNGLKHVVYNHIQYEVVLNASNQVADKIRASVRKGTCDPKRLPNP